MRDSSALYSLCTVKMALPYVPINLGLNLTETERYIATARLWGLTEDEPT